MNVDTGHAVCIFSHHARNYRNTQKEKLVCYPVYKNSVQSRIGINDLIFAERSRVTVIGCLNIGFNVFFYFRKLFNELQCDVFSFFRYILISAFIDVENYGHLLGKLVDDIFNKHGKIVPERVDLDRSVPEISRKYDLAKACKNINYGFPVRMIEYFDFLRRPFLFIIIKQQADNVIYTFFNRVQIICSFRLNYTIKFFSINFHFSSLESVITLISSSVRCLKRPCLFR